MRDILIESQTQLIDDVKNQNDGSVPYGFGSDDLLGLYGICLIHSELECPFAISVILENYLSEKELSTEAGYSLTFSVALNVIYTHRLKRNRLCK